MAANTGPVVGGIIQQFALEEWWFETFSSEDRGWMANTYRPLGLDYLALIEPSVPRATFSPYPTLANVATWFNKPGYKNCAIAFAQKADVYYSDTVPILSRHFGLYQRCEVFYRWRDDDPSALEAAVEACERAIAFHPDAARALSADLGWVPAHGCFRQLVIIEEKRGNFHRAMQLCQMAKEGGWSDDWDKRTVRLTKKLAKRAG